ncbi:MAG TPA: hypothetical protein PKO12_08330, partial [Holophaga sp.]|nr:hypothetical protein [Holophaga sp.]
MSTTMVAGASDSFSAVFEAETTGMLQSEVYALLAARKDEAAERNSFANDNEERIAALDGGALIQNTVAAALYF